MLTDALMPDVDGFALARQIAADARLSERQGHHAHVRPARSPDASAAAERTIASQLTKPVKQSDLLDAILTAFGAPIGSPAPDDAAVAAARPASAV